MIFNSNNDSVTDVGSTPYDDVFRTLVTEHRKLLLALINELFNLQDNPYDGSEKVLALSEYLLANRQNGEQDKIITDSAFVVIAKDGSRLFYHLECQSKADGSMIIRIFEYDSQIALRLADFNEDYSMEVSFPNTGVIFLRCSNSTPDKMTINIKVPNGEKISYSVPVLKLKNYTVNDIFARKLYFLIPFYLFNLEKYFDKIIKEDEITKYIFQQELRNLIIRLKECNETGKIDTFTYRSLLDFSRKVNTALTAGKDAVRKETEDIMRGKIINYEAKNILHQGEKHLLIKLVYKKHIKGMSAFDIAADLEEDFSEIEDICKAITMLGDGYTPEAVCEHVYPELYKID